MKKSRWISLLCLVSVIIAPMTAISASFSDVEDGSIHYGAIEYLYNKGVISGYPDGSFKPDQTINRAEALKMVMLATDKAGETEQQIDFPDVSEEDWFYEYVTKAVEIGLVEGYDDGTFKPANNINVAESIKIILLAFDEEIGNPPTQNPYPDVETSAWYSTYALYAKNKQYIESTDDGLLHAEKDITRGQFAEMIYRLLYVNENNLDKFPLSTNWPTYSDAINDYSLKYPLDWKIIKAGNQLILWKRDDINEQLSWARVLPYSATVVVAVEDNEAEYSLKEYVDLLEYNESATKNEQELNGYPFISVSLMDSGINDYYFEMPNGKILAAFTQVGGGANQPLLLEKIRYIVGSIRHYEGSDTSNSSLNLDRESFLEEVRKLVLEPDEGQNVLDMFDDEILIDTDTIGIGTGPVDYYYSAEYEVTLKLDRNSDTILAISDGNTTAF